MPANELFASHGPNHGHHSNHGIKPHPGPPTRHDKLVKNAQKVVSQTFFGTILKQMHNSPFKSKIFSGGRGGEAFGSLMDQHLADRMASGSGGKLVDAMVKKWDPPAPPAHGKASTQPASTQSADVKKQAAESAMKRGGYRKAPTVQWRQHVAADLRA